MKFITPREKILQRSPLKIDIGAGSKAERRQSAGIVTVDHLELSGVDIVCDLNLGFPDLPDNSVDEISSGNVLEHVDNLDFLMKEIHRVLKPGGEKHIAVPHFSNPYFYSDPTHKRFFGYYSFYYYSKNQVDIRRKVPAFYFDYSFDVISIRLTFYSLVPFLRPVAKAIEWVVNWSHLTQELYEFYLSHLLPCYGIDVRLRPVK